MLSVSYSKHGPLNICVGRAIYGPYWESVRGSKNFGFRKPMVLSYHGNHVVEANFINQNDVSFEDLMIG